MDRAADGWMNMERLLERREFVLKECVETGTLTHPKEDALGRVEAGGVDVRRVWRGSLAHDPAGEPRNGALGRQRVAVSMATRYGVHHHKIYGALGGPTDLQMTKESRVTFHRVNVMMQRKVSHNLRSLVHTKESRLISVIQIRSRFQWSESVCV